MAVPENTKAYMKPKAFSKGFLHDFGDDLLPKGYCEDILNMRIEGDSCVSRPGQITRGTKTAPTYVRGITANYQNDELLVVMDSDLFSFVPSTGVYTKIDDLNGDTDYNFINYRQYTIIMDGQGFPRVYDGSTVTQLTSTNIETNANPLFGTVYTNFTVVAGTGDKSNLLYISRPILKGTETNAYNWDGTNGGDIRTMTSPIQALVATQARLYIFCENSVEYLDRSTTASVGGSTVFYTQEIGPGYDLPNNRCVAHAGEFVFFLTANKKIKTINYTQGTVNPYVSDLSDPEGSMGIDKRMQDNLHDDQSKSSVHYDRQANVVKFNVRLKGQSVPSYDIIRDIGSQSRLKDNNKFFADAVQYDQKVYRGSVLSGNIIEDEVGRADDEDKIYGYRLNRSEMKTSIGARSMVRGYTTEGRINALGQIKVSILVDRKIKTTKTVTGTGKEPSVEDGGATGSAAVGEHAIGGPLFLQNDDLERYMKKLGKAQLRHRGTRFQSLIEFDKLNTKVSLENEAWDIGYGGDVTLKQKT